jgi:CRP/FNR family transcriptional regulator, cyclic AMP receptor protein
MDPAQARASLRAVEILSGLPEAELDRLASQLTWRRVSAGEEVLSHLAKSDQVYFVIEGVFRALMTTAYGRQVAIRSLQAGAHFGEIAALTGAPRSLTVAAETDGLIGECTAAAFRELMNRNAEFASAMAASLARNVVLLTDRLFELAALEMRFRVYAELLRLARSGETTAEGIMIRGAPTHELIAAAIGAQREQVTKELRTLAAEGLIRQGRREILITDMEKLRTMVQRRAGVTATHVVDWRF